VKKKAWPITKTVKDLNLICQVKLVVTLEIILSDGRYTVKLPQLYICDIPGAPSELLWEMDVLRPDAFSAIINAHLHNLEFKRNQYQTPQSTKCVTNIFMLWQSKEFRPSSLDHSVMIAKHAGRNAA
jgi:hypothetical protein